MTLSYVKEGGLWTVGTLAKTTKLPSRSILQCKLKFDVFHGLNISSQQH